MIIHKHLFCPCSVSFSHSRLLKLFFSFILISSIDLLYFTSVLTNIWSSREKLESCGAFKMVASLLLTLRFTNIHFSNYFYFYVFFCIILGYNSANPLPNVKNKVVNIAVVLAIVQIQALSYIKKKQLCHALHA